jgi:hypothetical protein
MPNEINLDGRIDAKGVKFIGKATRQDNGMYRCLADVGGCLCIVECRIIPKDEELEDSWADLRHVTPARPEETTPKVMVTLYDDDALLLQGHLRSEMMRFRDAGNDGMVSMLERVEDALAKARGK